MQINSRHILKYCLWNSWFSPGNAETGIFQSPPCHPHPLQKTLLKDKSLVWSFPRKKQKHSICYFVSKEFTHSCKMQTLWGTVTLTLADMALSRRGRVPGIELQGFKEMPRAFVHAWNINNSLLRYRPKDVPCHILGFWEFQILKWCLGLTPSSQGMGWASTLTHYAAEQFCSACCLHTRVLFFR